ncbi:hypothetical protein IWQ61_008183 [Dispira simplex]|nr:hypothetical protein IWQ61_008183 [Dispira simplex]
MPSATDKDHLLIHRTICEKLLSELDQIELNGNLLFQRLQQALWFPYPADNVKEELDKLLDSITGFTEQLRLGGHLGTTGESPTFSTMVDANKFNDKRIKATDTMCKSRERVIQNVNAALSVGTTSKPTTSSQ